MPSPEEFRQLADRVRRFTADTQSIRAEYDRAEVSGVSPDGAVRVTMRGGRIAGLDMDPSVLNHDNVYVANQVLAAIRRAEDQSAEFLGSRTAPMNDAVTEIRNFLR
ncbi:YbaB/EbfC family nucleoid-associated protein [Actinoplanes sp. TBRC 11911]|uniref:YbaB/EbfC family nucleoid-associated protein n=1 Tax=Actinoplanes sp. TBRC 11911 TaxID=2729386 RepID=UPI00145D7AB1|nr:YbaB/EbfC family nucleoid-associated protein [Actinoplanes sp. TBRC 11911]NMO54028.1 YbaB/EbfC family nucleoid-associated protein [Actinoplanes sp. TBRC 11911]